MILKSLGAGFRPAVLSALALAVLAAPATAAPPSAQNYTISAAPSGTLDALAQDSDPDSDAMSISANSQPAHGSASCSALGACFYTATAGYTGADSFTYTVRANGDEATGTITVNVGASGSSGAFQLRDDDAATRFGHAIDIDVLANDTGTGLTVTSNGDPQHGTVSCDADGSCHYTPADGYSGSDGFVYTATDNSERRATAAVHILVAPPGAGYRIGVHGSPDPVGPGGQAQWGVAVGSMPGGITGDELLALDLPVTSAKLGGQHAITGGSLQLAPGWTGDTDGGVLHAKAGKSALLGEAATRTFPRPLPPVSQGTGGDGHVPILVGSKVFAFYHHSHPTSVTCVDRSTGSVCPGYPKVLPGFGTTDINGPAVVSGSKLYTHLVIDSGFAQSASIGLYCWDADTNSTCGLKIVGRTPGTGNPGASAPVSAGGNAWLGADTGKAYCLNPATGDPCGSIDTGLPTTAAGFDSVAHGSRVFISRSDGAVGCVDVAAGARCTGWDTPKTFAGNAWNLVNQHDGSGAAIGVCAFRQSNGSCVTDADPATQNAVTNWVSREIYDVQGYSYTQEAEVGSRTLEGSLDGQGLGCYDWSTMKPCTGGSYGANGAPPGWINHQDNGTGLPSRGAYGATYDGSCVIALGDDGQVYTVDPAGSAPCTSLGSGADRMRVDLRDQRCDGSVGSATWRDVKLSDTDSKEMESLVVTVRDGRTDQVLKTGDLVAGDGTLDLSGIDAQAHPVLTVDGNAKGKSGSKAWDDGIPPRITLRWNSDAQQACVRTAATECGTGTTPISLLGHMSSPSEGDASAQLSLFRAACGTPIARNEVLSATARKCSGARQFRIRIRYKGSKVRKVTVTANGVKQKVRTLRPRPIASIDLRRQAKQTTVVRITIITKSGKRLTGKRVYHPCTKKLPDRGFKY